MKSFDLEAFLFEVRRFWWLILLTTIVALGWGYVMHLLAPVEYKSDTKMVVDRKANIPSASVYSEQAADFLGTQAAIMQSRDVRRDADKALRQQGKLPPEKGVELQATYIPKTTVFILEASSTDPDYTRAYLQEAIRAYIDLSKRMRSDQSREAVSALAEEVVRVRGEVDAATRDLNNFQQKISVGSLEGEVTAENAYLGSLRKRYANLRLQKSIAVTGTPDPNAAATAAIQGADKGDVGGLLPDQAGQQVPDQQMLQAKQNLAMLQAEKARLQNNLRRDHPKIKQIDLRIREAQNLVGFLQDQTKHGNTERVESIDREMTALQDEIAQREQKINQLNHNIAEYQTLKDRLASNRETYQRLTNSVQNVDVARQVDQEVINVLESPSTPVPVRTHVLITLAESSAVGLVLGVGATFLFSRLARRFQTISQVKRTLGLPVFGKILHDGWITTRQRTVLDCTRKHIGFAESFRNLRSTLMLLPPSVRDRRCIAVTSACPNEGKSTIAVNMAIALAATNSRVLLIDADLRRGKLHQLLKVKTGPGFSDLLMRKSSVQQATHSTRMQNLMLLPSGNRVPNVSEQIFRSNFDRTLEELCQEFDYVILDTPPVLATDDGPTMAAKADWALFVVRLRYSRPRETEKALEELRMRQVEVPGVVVNSVSKRDTGHSYYHYACSLEERPFAGMGLPERTQPAPAQN
jgi:succinoglycan biosynthesis transport protein ExoP